MLLPITQGHSLLGLVLARSHMSIRELVSPTTILAIGAAWLKAENRTHARRAVAIEPDLLELQRSVNQCLWRIKDEIRDHKRHQEFSARFIELVRSPTSPTPGERRSNKGSEAYGSEIVEVKGYKPQR